MPMQSDELHIIAEPMEVIHHHPIFVKDTSKFWYKPRISREDGECFFVTFFLDTMTFLQLLIYSKTSSRAHFLYATRTLCQAHSVSR